MSGIQIDRLLDTVVRHGASDLHLTVGRRPTIRLHGDLKDLQTKILDSDDMVSLMKAITPERNQQELQEVGGTDFGFAYGDAARFRVSIFRQRNDLAIVCRQIPNRLLTFEQIGLPEAISRACQPGTRVLVDCLTLWLSNLMEAGADIAAHTQPLLAALGRSQARVILVSNEVGQGIVPDNALARRFRDEAGLLHQRIAAAADEVQGFCGSFLQRPAIWPGTTNDGSV